MNRILPGWWNSQVDVGSCPRDDGTVMQRVVVVLRMTELSGRGG